MKIIGTFGLAVMASFGLLHPAHGSSRGSGRFFSSSQHFSAPAVHHSSQSRNFSSGGARYYAPSTRLSSGATFRKRSDAGSSPGRLAFDPTSALNPRFNSATRPRFAADQTPTRNFRNYSAARPAAGRAGALRSQGSNPQGRILARYGSNWHRNWDRHRDHFWRGHRCHWHNNAWIIFDTFFYPYGFGFYPYGAYSYYDDGYYDNRYASNDYSQERYPAQTDYDDSAAEASVSQVQSALAREGYYSGAIDGSLGPGTRNALRRYQRDHGLAVTGRVDAPVIAALGSR